MRLYCFIIVMLGLALNPVAGSAESDERREPRRVHVPGDARTIQEAISLVADGGTVRIAPGTYSESVDIVGKRVNLIGAGRRGLQRTVIMGEKPTEFVPLSRARGLINYGADGRGRLENLMLFGGDVAVFGLANERVLPAEVSIRNVSMVRNGRGVAGNFSRLGLNDVSIVKSFVHGISLPCFHDLELFNAFVANAGQLGILLISCTGNESVSVDNSIIASNFGGGAAFFGNMTIGITDSTFPANRIFGILLAEVSNTTLVINTSVFATTKGDTPEFSFVGDGLMAVRAGKVFMLDSTFAINERAGVLLVDAPTEGRFVQTVVAGNRFGIALAKDSTGECGAFVEIGTENIIASNTEKDILQGCGDLPVPDAPPPLPPDP